MSDLNFYNIKTQYNKCLKRFENGCVYLGKNPKDIPKYLPELIRITKDLGLMIDIVSEKHKYIMTNDEINNGFKIKGE